MDTGKLFSLSGRIGRKDYIVIWLVAVAVSVAGVLIADWLGEDNETLGNLLLFGGLVAAFAIQVPAEFKRLHDTGKFGWWLLAGFIPIIGGIYMLWLLIVKPGEPGPNEYGLPNCGSPFPS